MGSYNKAQIMGNLGKDPELKYTEKGTAVVNLSVATNDRWKDESGAIKEKTVWHRIVVWGDDAVRCAKYLKKGDRAFYEGPLETSEWEDKDGKKHSVTQIKAKKPIFLGGGKKRREGTEEETDEEAAAGAGAMDEDIAF